MRRRRSLTRQDQTAAPAPDLIGRDFTADDPGRRLVGDITYLPTAEGWLYLATTIDLHTREVVGHALAGHMRAQLVADAVALAVNNRPRKTLGWKTPAEVFDEQLRSLQQPSVATTG